jgi:hypothetical protein
MNGENASWRKSTHYREDPYPPERIAQKALHGVFRKKHGQLAAP